MSTYVETWKGIAHALGRSERWCRYMAQRSDDPLPVFKVGGIVRLNGEDLEDWLVRQRERSLAGGEHAPARQSRTSPDPAGAPLALAPNGAASGPGAVERPGVNLKLIA